jgi:hypothetical protein
MKFLVKVTYKVRRKDDRRKFVSQVSFLQYSYSYNGLEAWHIDTLENAKVWTSKKAAEKRLEAYIPVLGSDYESIELVEVTK